MPFGYIYKIEFPNGKVYIGQTSRTLEQRKKEHYRDAKNGNTRYVYNELRYYNMVNTFEVIEIDTADTKEELDEKEMGYIKMYNSLDREYGCNRTMGGDGFIGYIHAEEDRKKMSESHKQRYRDNPEEGRKHSERMKQYYIDNPEEIQKNKERQKQYFIDNPEERQKCSERMKQYFIDNPEAGRKHSEKMKKTYEKPGAREKLSETMKKYYEENPETREKLSETMKKYYEENPETKEKQSEAHKKYFKETPEAREKNSKAIKKYYEETPEAREKTSKAVKKYYEENPETREKILDTKGQNKPFDVFTTDGTFVKSFTYQMNAKEYLKNEYNITSNISIGLVLRGMLNSSAGFVFKYKN